METAMIIVASAVVVLLLRAAGDEALRARRESQNRLSLVTMAATYAALAALIACEVASQQFAP